MAAIDVPVSLCGRDKDPPDGLGFEVEVIGEAWGGGNTEEEADAAELEGVLDGDNVVLGAEDELLGRAAVVDGANVGEVSPPYVQTPSVPRGILGP